MLALWLLLPPMLSALAPPDLLLYDGVSLFSRGDWLGARDRLRGALHSAREVRGARLRCGAGCGLLGSEGLLGARGLGSEGLLGARGLGSEGLLGARVLARARCLQSCERLQLGEPSRYRLTGDTERGFQRGAAYNYLQLVHYKLEELDEAAAAAFTFYLRNPRHEQIQQDVQRYRRMKGVSEQSFRDLEEPRHRILYSQAVSLLSEGKIGSAVLRLEESLQLSLSALEECRTLCEGTREKENEAHRDLSEVIAEYYTQVLQCKQHCVLEDSVRLGQNLQAEKVIVSQLSLLLESYSRLGDLESVAQMARLLLLFHPQDESMKERLRGYEDRLQDKADGQLHQLIILYVQRALSEKRLLYYAMENLGISFQDPDSWSPEEVIPESVKARVRMEREAEEQRRVDLPYEQVTVTLTPKQMNGTRRVTLDGVIGQEECEMLLSLAQVATGSGNGFHGRRSPHTTRERIQDLSVLRALQMASSGDADPSHARLYYQTSERSRVLAQAYFGTKSLHFSYTHLVCRSAIEGEQTGRVDPSHPVHADNCLLDPEEKKCWREAPAYIHRDYSGVLYLNDNFQGGDLFFTELDGKTETAELRPRCGRLVLFSAGEENPHGVRAVTQGTRCAISLFFTESLEHAEQERSQAKILMGEDSSSQERSEPETDSTSRETARTGRETARNSRETGRSGQETSSDPARPSGRSQNKRVSSKLEDEL